MNSFLWQKELRRQLLWMLLAWLPLLFLGEPLWSALSVLLLALVWNLWQLNKVIVWLAEGGKPKKSPESRGGWEQLIQLIYQTQQLNRTRKQRLAKVLKRFHRSLDALPDATILLDQEDEIEWVNLATAALLGIQNPQDHGQKIDNLIRNPAFHAYLRRGDFDHSLEIFSPVRSQMTLNVRIVPFGEGRLLSVRDVSDFQRLQQARREFVANVSHELRTPLTVMRGYIDVLTEEAQEASKPTLLAIQRQVLRMEEMVRDLLILSRLEMASPLELEEGWVDVPRLLRSLCEDARLLASSSDHRIECQLEPLLLRGNRKNLLTLFSNLLYNAVQHTLPGTAIMLSWSREPEGGRFAVRDTGAGIEAQHLDRLTERFYRLDAGRSRDKGGTGLGLAIVKHILTQYDSQLEIESQRGKGSTFSCRFSAQRVRPSDPKKTA